MKHTLCKWVMVCALLCRTGLGFSIFPTHHSFSELLVPFNFGTQTAYNVSDGQLAEVSGLGFKYFRMVLNPFNDLLRPALICEYLWSQGITPFFILMSDPNHPPTTEAEQDLFAAASAKAAATIAGFNEGARVAWEVWNEPDNAPFWMPQPNPIVYATLALKTAVAIRNASPHLVVAPGLGTMGADSQMFLQNVLNTEPSLVSWLDGLSFHGYEASGQLPPEGRAAFFQELRAMTAIRGRELPLVNSELGWAVSPSFGKMSQQGPAIVSPETQAAYVVRHNLFNLMQGIPVTIGYQLQASPDRVGPGGSILEDGFGLLDAQGNPRPSFGAIAAMNANLAGLVFLKAIQGGPAYVLLFQSPNGSVAKLAAWTTGRNQVLRLGQGRVCRTQIKLSSVPTYVPVRPGCF